MKKEITIGKFKFYRDENDIMPNFQLPEWVASLTDSQIQCIRDMTHSILRDGNQNIVHCVNMSIGRDVGFTCILTANRAEAEDVIDTIQARYVSLGNTIVKNADRMLLSTENEKLYGESANISSNTN